MEIYEGPYAKLHLGCGEKYLEGYTNIDYPPEEHSVMEVKADEYGDVRRLSYSTGTVEEVRTHHMFEHFHRAEALWLLFEWRRWLKVGGKVVIETPDFTASSRGYVLALGRRRKFALGRHIFGSQEALWADHLDFWDARKFRYVLRKAGFKKVRIRKFSNSFGKKFERIPFANFVGSLLPEMFYKRYGGNKLPNIVVVAEKDARELNERAVVCEILQNYLVGREGAKMLEAWMGQYDRIVEERGR